MVRRLLAAALLSLPVTACTDDSTGRGRQTRVVCIAANRVVLDDFAVKDSQVVISSGSLQYDSETVHGSVNAQGSCVSYPQDKPAGWRPTLPA